MSTAGLFGSVFGHPSGVMGYLTPAIVIIVALGCIAGLESAKKRA